MNVKLKRPLQALLIAPDKKMGEDVLSGNKKITIREGWRDYQPALSVLCCPIEPWCVGINITDVKYKSIKEVTPEEYLADGFKSRDELIEGLKKYYPNINLESKVTVICWDKINGKLVDEYNKKWQKKTST